MEDQIEELSDKAAQRERLRNVCETEGILYVYTHTHTHTHTHCGIQLKLYLEMHCCKYLYLETGMVGKYKLSNQF